MIRRHAPEQTVVVAASDLSTEALFRAIPGVESVSNTDGRFTIRGKGDDLVTGVIGCVADHQIKVTDFRTDRSTLEDVFLNVTGHSIRN